MNAGSRPAPEVAEGSAYFVPAGDGLYLPTIHVQGAWRDWEQHMAPVAGLAAHVLEAHEARPEMQLSRITYEILGIIPLRPTAITVRTVRPGRTIELVEAMVSIDGQDVIRATGWRLAVHDTAQIAGGAGVPLPHPEELTDWEMTSHWGGGFIASLEVRRIRQRPGRAQAWLGSAHPLLEGEAVGPVAEFVRLVDTANGIATRVRPEEASFPNVDLTIHLFRVPTPGWVGFDTTVAFGETGLGLTTTTLHDVHGPVGRAEQMLTVRAGTLPGR